MANNEAVSVSYVDENGKEVRISQNIKSGGIMVISKADEDRNLPMGRIVKKGEYALEFHAMGGPDMPRYDENGLIDWYNTEYRKIQKNIKDSLEDYLKAKNLPNFNKPGHWLDYDDTERFTAKCSECGYITDTRDDISRCKGCGAKMRQ